MATIDTVKLSNFDRFVNLHQSVKLEQIAKTNRQLLEQSVIQNKQLETINKQLAEATSINKTILENQLNEIKDKEIQKFYKNLIFNVEAVISQLETLSSTEIKGYFISNFKSKLNIIIDDCINNLSEISDKSFGKNLQLKIENLVSSNQTDVLFSQFNSSIQDYNALLQKKVELDEKYKKATISPSGILAKVVSQTMTNTPQKPTGIGRILLGVPLGFSILMLILVVFKWETVVFVFFLITTIIFGLLFTKANKSYKTRMIEFNNFTTNKQNNIATLEKDISETNLKLEAHNSKILYKDICDKYIEFEPMLYKLATVNVQ